MALDRRFESLRFPYLPFLVMLGTFRLSILALLDTGFDGDLAIPTDMLHNLALDGDFGRWRLADGSLIFAPVYQGTAALADFARVPVRVAAMGDEPLVGRGVSDRFTITLDHGRRLTVEP